MDQSVLNTLRKFTFFFLPFVYVLLSVAHSLSYIAPKDDEGYEHALTILRLEHELEEILKYVSVMISSLFNLDLFLIFILICRREAQVAQLTKDRDAYIRAKKEIKIKTDAVDVHLAGFARVRCSCLPPPPSFTLVVLFKRLTMLHKPDRQCCRLKGQRRCRCPCSFSFRSFDIMIIRKPKLPVAFTARKNYTQHFLYTRPYPESNPTGDHV